MSNITRVGFDLAKNVIQVHAVDAVGKVVTNRALNREKFLLCGAPICLKVDWSRWRPAVAPTTGAASYASVAWTLV